MFNGQGPFLPEVETLTPTNVSANGATLRARIAPWGARTPPLTVSFLLNGVSLGSVPVDESVQEVILEWPVTDLLAGTLYSASSVSQDGWANTTNGGSVPFTTLGQGTPPQLTTLAPTHLAKDSAVLRASVDPKGRATTVEFFLNGESKGRFDAGSGNGASVIEVPVAGLVSGTEYTVTTRAFSMPETPSAIPSPLSRAFHLRSSN